MFYKFSKGETIYSVPNGVGDGSAFFSGSGTYIKDTVSGIPSGNNPFSLSIWFKKMDSNYDADLVGWGIGELGKNLSLYFQSSNNITVAVYGSGQRVASYEVGKWHNIIITHNGDGYINFYLDGAYVTNWRPAHTLDLSPTNFGFCNGGNTAYNGFIKDVLIYNRALTATEVETLYNKGTVEDGLVLNIPLQYGKDNDSIFTSKNFVYDIATLTTSSGFDEWGYPIRHRSASKCGIAYNLIPTKGLIFYAPCETDASVKVGNQFTTSGEFTTQVVDDIKCLKFNVPYTQEVDTNVFVRNQVTLSALYYKKQTNTSGIVLGYGTDSIYCYFAIEEYYGQFYINHAMARLGTGYNMEDDKWYHLALTLDNTTIKAYVNGELVSTFTCDMNLHGGYLGLGGWAYGNGSDSPNGYITKCRIYNRPLTEKEIQQLAKEF